MKYPGRVDVNGSSMPTIIRRSFAVIPECRVHYAVQDWVLEREAGWLNDVVAGATESPQPVKAAG